MATSAPKSAPKSTSRNTAQEEPSEDTPKPKKSRKKLIIILVFALVLLGGIGGGIWWFMDDDEDEAAGNTNSATSETTGATTSVKTAEKKAKAEKPVPPVFVNLEQFTVNLQPEAGEHFLQIAMTLQVATKEDVDMIKLYMPQIRSRILLLLSSKKASEISTLEGKKKLSSEIMAQVNQPLTPQGNPQTVSNVFFTSFVIQ
jgi:flagellar protein FliL